MGTIIVPTKTDTTKTTCIEITSESYKCIDISAFVPQCITITSNVPTSDLYQEQYNRDPVEVTEAPQLQIALINNEAPILNVNMDEDGVYYVTDFDTVYIDITNWNANAEYVNIFSNQDGNEAVIFLDEAEQRIIWSLDDYALDGTQMWLNAQAKESEKLISPQSSVTVMQMEQTDQPNLSSWVSQTEQSVLNITILDYDETYTYADPIVTGGTAVRTDNIIAWTLPDVTEDTYHEISITATAPLMYESLAEVSGGSVIECSYASLVGDEINVSYKDTEYLYGLVTYTYATKVRGGTVTFQGVILANYYLTNAKINDYYSAVAECINVMTSHPEPIPEPIITVLGEYCNGNIIYKKIVERTSYHIEETDISDATRIGVSYIKYYTEKTYYTYDWK